MPPRPRPQSRRGQPRAQPSGWIRPAEHIPIRTAPPTIRTRRPNRRPWWIALALVLSLVAASWFFVLRDSAPSSEFVRASDRFVAAVDRIHAGAVDISRFLDLPRYDELVDEELRVMDDQIKVFERLARTEDGEAARIARDAADAAKRGRFAAGWFTQGILERKLTTANRANGELGAAAADLRLFATQWEEAK